MSGEDGITNGHRCGDNAAAYVLGALEPSELDAFRRHLAGCAACQKQVAEFERSRVRCPSRPLQYQVPTDLRRRVLTEVRATPKAAAYLAGPTQVRRERSWRPFVAWGGALAAVVVAVILAFALSSGGSGGTRVIQASAGNAELQVAGGHGDLIVHRLPQLPPGRIYEMWVERGDAAPTPTGTLFAVTPSGRPRSACPAASVESVRCS